MPLNTNINMFNSTLVLFVNGINYMLCDSGGDIPFCAGICLQHICMSSSSLEEW